MNSTPTPGETMTMTTNTQPSSTSVPPASFRRALRSLSGLAAATCLTAGLGIGGTADADVFTVALDGTADFTTIQAAVNAASDGDEIQIQPGVYENVSADLNAKQLHFSGQGGPGAVVLTKTNGNMLYDADRGGRFEGLTFLMSAGYLNGVYAIRATSVNPTAEFLIEDCVFINQSGSNIYAIYAQGASNDDFDVRCNSSTLRSAWTSSNAPLVFEDCDLSGSASGPVEIMDCRFQGFSFSGSATLDRCTGTLSSSASNAEVVLRNSQLSCVFYLQPGSNFTVDSCELQSNATLFLNYDGQSSLSISGSTLVANRIIDSSITYDSCDISIIDSQLTSTDTAIYHYDGSLFIENSNIDSDEHGVFADCNGNCSSSIDVDIISCRIRSRNNEAILIESSSSTPNVIQSCALESPSNHYALNARSGVLVSDSQFCGEAIDVLTGAWIDAGGNSFGIDCTADCNANDIPDEIDIANGDSLDCDLNGRPDECDLADGLATDCNGNGILDSCDLFNGASDCNANGVLDECEPDCDGDGILDECAIANGADDCNLDGIPDSCQIASGALADANNDGIPDACQNMAFTGLSLEINPIQGRILDSEIPLTAVSYRLYATVESPNAAVLGLYGDAKSPLAINATSGFWQYGLGGNLSSSVPCDEKGMFPDLRFDSWLTVGATCASDDMTLDIGIDYTDFNNGGGIATDDGVVFVDPDQPQSFPDADGRVLLAQLTSFDGSIPTGQFNVVGLNPDGSEWYATGVTWPEPPLVDCNGNGIQDAYDINNGTSRDCDGSGVPDECEYFELIDCNNNGIADICDIADGTSADANGDFIPDECACYGDATRDGLVNVDDIIKVIVSWGDTGFSYADINGDLVVDGDDLSAVLAAFGGCG